MPRGGRRPGAGRPKGSKDRIPRLTKQQRLELLETLRDPVVTARAREVVATLLEARRFQSAPLPSSRLGSDAKAELDRTLGPGNWCEHKGRLFWVEPNVEIRLAAAREVLNRDEPALNRVDAHVSGSYVVRRLDPNEESLAE